MYLYENLLLLMFGIEPPVLDLKLTYYRFEAWPKFGHLSQAVFYQVPILVGHVSWQEWTIA